MRRIARATAIFLALMPAMAGAQDWQVLRGQQVRAALEGRKLVHAGGAVQDFRASGRTLYNAGRDSWGNWRVEGDQYCSQWPPSDLWACFDLLVAPDAGGLRFVGASGDVSEGRYSD